MPGARGLWIVFFTYIVDVFGQSVIEVASVQKL